MASFLDLMQAFSEAETYIATKLMRRRGLSGIIPGKLMGLSAKV
jgi:hypothetical protein